MMPIPPVDIFIPIRRGRASNEGGGAFESHKPGCEISPSPLFLSEVGELGFFFFFFTLFTPFSHKDLIPTRFWPS